MDKLWMMQGPLWDADKGGGGGDGDPDPDNNGDGDPGDDDPKKKDKNMVPITRLNEVISQRDEGKASIKKLEIANKKLASDLKKLQDTGKSDSEKLVDQVGGLETQLKAETRKREVLELSARHEIPEELQSRLQGETFEELEEDAIKLSEYIKSQAPDEDDEDDDRPPGSPPVKRGGRGKKTFDIRGKTPAEIRKAHKDGKLGL